MFLALCEKELKLTGDMKVTKEQLYSVTRARGKQNDPIQSNRPRSTIIRFQNEKYRNIVFKKKKDLKGKGIVLTEFLTTRRSQLLKECITKIPGDFSTRSIWTDSGKILVKIKDNDDIPITHIVSSNDITKFLSDHPQIFPATIV